MLNELEQVLPADIEKRSFEIITEELGAVSIQARILTMRTILPFPTE